MDNTKLNEILNYLLEVAKDAGTFAKNELPLVCNEIIRYEIASSVIAILFSSLILATFLYLLRKMLQRLSNEIDKLCTLAIGMAFSLLLVVFIAYNVDEASKAYLAPRLLLIEKVKKLVK